MLAARHDRNSEPGWWREPYRQLGENSASYPAYSKDDLARIPNPLLLIAGGGDLRGNLDHLVDVRKAIPNVELLLIDHAPREVRYTHSRIVGPRGLDFLERNPEAA